MIVIRLTVVLLFAFSVFSFAHADTTGFHQNYRTLDHRVQTDHSPWMSRYQRAVNLAQTGQPELALTEFETLLTEVAHRENDFSRAFVRYFTLTEQQAQLKRAEQFFSALVIRHPKHWIKGAFITSKVLVETQALNRAFDQRLRGDTSQPELASNLAMLYRLTLPLAMPGEYRIKRETIDEWSRVYSNRLHRDSLERLASLRYVQQPIVAINVTSIRLLQAFASEQPPVILDVLADWLAQLIAHDQLPQGRHTLASLPILQQGNATLSLVQDWLVTAQENHRLFSESIRQIQALRQDAPSSMLLAVMQSTLQFYDLTGGFNVADQTLVDFATQHPYVPHVTQVIAHHRHMLANWSGQIKRHKRDSGSCSSAGGAGGLYSNVNNGVPQVGAGKLVAPLVNAVKQTLTKVFSRDAGGGARQDNPAPAPSQGAANTGARTGDATAERLIQAERVGSGLKDDVAHRAASFPSREQIASGQTFTLRGGDNVERTLLQTPGGLNGKNGIYEYIYDSAGRVTHQRFIEGGKINGIPNQRVSKAP